MKSVGVMLWAVGGSLLLVTAEAACPPEAWMCASPMNQTNPNDPSRLMLKEDPTLFESRHFALQRDDSEPGRAHLRPVIKLNDDFRVSVKIKPNSGEIKLKWRW